MSTRFTIDVSNEAATWIEAGDYRSAEEVLRAGLVAPFEGVVIACQVSDAEIRIRRVFGAAQDYEGRLLRNQ